MMGGCTYICQAANIGAFEFGTVELVNSDLHIGGRFKFDKAKACQLEQKYCR